MRYTRDSIRADLKRLGVSWDWAGDKPTAMRADVKARLTAAGGSGDAGPFDEIAEYCWFAYEKAVHSQGHLVIGRVPDLNAAGLYSKVGEILYTKVGDVEKETTTMFDASSEGNLLKVDKWARVVNDSWVLGGVHRHGLFRLASPRVMKNLWNENGYFVVTARELLGLLNFGYQVEQVGPWQVLSCKNTQIASAADLIKYDQLIKSGQTLGEAQRLQDTVGSSARAQEQVSSFFSG